LSAALLNQVFSWAVIILGILTALASGGALVTRNIVGRQQQADVAAANHRAVEAQRALAQFKAPRALTPEQQAKISEKLKRFAGTKFGAGIGPKGDPEPLYILRNIVSALSSAGWVQLAWSGGGETYTEAPMLSVGLTMVTNVIVDVHPDFMAKYGAAAQTLADALNAEGIDAIAESRPTTINTDAIHLRIGRKL
jgi:type II secretory pathway pseudopilin PulG